jgi:UDP-N-acetylmuramoyl-tripeptide--D-alanyl-D-alanine ligase
MKNFFQIPFFHIYLLQLENFDLTRTITAAFQKVFPSSQSFRENITWTKKLTLIVLLAVLLTSLAAATTFLAFPAVVWRWVVSVSVFVGLLVWFVIPISFATILIRPIDRLIRGYLRQRAHQKIARLKNLTVIGVTGSYGKTTMKQTLKILLSGSLDVAATPASFNKPVSIARFILSSVTEETDVVIVEMGAYQKGDIAELCAMTPPDISVLTGINEAHLERFGSIENTIQGKFEIITEAKSDTPLIANADDPRVTENYEEFTGNHEAVFFSSENHEKSEFTVKDKRFHTDGSGISFHLHRDGDEIGYTKVPHLGEYIVGNVIAGVLVGRYLGIGPKEILKQAQKITPAERRLQPVQRTSSDILVIDDSYNGTSDGVKAAIQTLGKFVGRRKMCVTTGLVEIGDQSEKIHKDIGRQLGNIADTVVLVESSVTGWIRAGLEDADFSGELHTFKDTETMRSQISNLTVSGDVVLFQNDWPQNYQ